MRKDLHGLTLSTNSGTAVDAFDRATQSYLKYRTDAGRHLAAALKADPSFALAHVLRGYFAMLTYNTASLPAAAEALRRGARPCQAHHDARGGACRGPGALARRRPRAHARRLGSHPGRAPARRPGLPAAPFLRLLAGTAGDHAGRGRARLPALERRAARLGHGAVLPLLRARGGRQLHPGRGRRTDGDRGRSGRPVGRPRASPTCSRCRAGAARASTG